MVKTIFILTGLFFSLAQPQVLEQSNFKLENKEVFYERVFEVENTSPDELVKIIENRLKTVLQIETIEVTKNTINAENSGILIDYKNHGQKSMKKWRVLNCYTASNITIEVSPNKYKLRVTDIEFECNLPRPAVYKLNKKSTVKGLEFKKTQMTADGLTLLDNYFTDTFDVTKK